MISGALDTSAIASNQCRPLFVVIQRCGFAGRTTGNQVRYTRLPVVLNQPDQGRVVYCTVTKRGDGRYPPSGETARAGRCVMTKVM